MQFYWDQDDANYLNNAIIQQIQDEPLGKLIKINIILHVKLIYLKAQDLIAQYLGAV